MVLPILNRWTNTEREKLANKKRQSSYSHLHKIAIKLILYLDVCCDDVSSSSMNEFWYDIDIHIVFSLSFSRTM